MRKQNQRTEDKGMSNKVTTYLPTYTNNKSTCVVPSTSTKITAPQYKTALLKAHICHKSDMNICNPINNCSNTFISAVQNIELEQQRQHHHMHHHYIVLFLQILKKHIQRHWNAGYIDAKNKTKQNQSPEQTSVPSVDTFSIHAVLATNTKTTAQRKALRIRKHQSVTSLT